MSQKDKFKGNIIYLSLVIFPVILGTPAVVVKEYQCFAQEIVSQQEVPGMPSSKPAPQGASPPTSQTAQESSHQLTPYGYDLFQQPGQKVEGLGGYILPPNYRLGPGDKIGIYLLGEVQKNFEVIVNVEGKVFIPTVGVFPVWGLTMEEFKQLLDQKLASFYDKYEIDLMLISPKYVQVAVVGDVNSPGKYLISALKTVLDAIILAGGPTPQGSLRDIRLFRKGEFFTSVDLYQFLMKGETKQDIYLETEDRIFVPLWQARVSISGEVKRPATFELKPGANERLSDLIELAGGFTDYAFLDKIELSRVQENGERTLIYVDYNLIAANDSSEANLLLQNDDRIQVYSKLDQLHRRVVHILGEVKRPGEYTLEDNMRVSDLILKAGNLTRSAYTLEAEVAKIDPKAPARFIKINLQQLLNDHDSSQDLLLEEDDKVFIRKIPEWEVGPMVEVRGEVMFPGFYSITKDSTKLSEIMEKAGGFTKDALIREATLIRKSSRLTIDKEYERLKSMPRDQMNEYEYQYLVMKQNMQDVGRILVDFYKLVILKDKREDVVLEDEDVIYVPKAPTVVTVTGRVSNPGGVLYEKGKSLKYYLKKAGGATWDANVRKTKITKVTGEILDDEDVKEFVPGDIIWVPRKPHRDWWEIFRLTIATTAQVATIFLIIQNFQRK
ncbi:MAG: SLBB domain-containing protein [candidate division KSB1 bacterium]|nr:SLBB domain-containing protein [candidate division KSB1 bacterium]